MKRGNWLVVPALLAVVMSLALAGGPGHKCTKSVEDCLTSMTTEIKAHGYIGIDTDKDESTGAISVKRVLPGSPAEAAGLQPGDVLVAMNGVRFGDEKNEEKLYATKKTLKVGSEVTYTIKRNGYEKQVAMKLAPVPEDVLAQWVGHHMLEHANEQVAKN